MPKSGKGVELKITVPAERVGDVLKKLTSEAVRVVQLEGFRKGHAPEKLAKEKLDMERIYSQVINQAVSEAYTAAVKEHHLKPIVAPKIELLQFDRQAKKDIIFTAITAERPRVEVGDYKKALKELGTPSSPSHPSGHSLDKVLKTVLSTAEVELPEILVDAEVNRMLSRLVDQTGRLGLTVEQYLTSQGKTAESLRTAYLKQAEESLKTEFVLDEIARLENVEVMESEIDEVIKANPDEQAKKELEKEENKWYTKSILRRNKTLEHLLKLTK